jgi:DNA-binding transcriptional MerR regulator
MMKPVRQTFTRAQAAEKLGISPETLRYYEKLGLIPEPERAVNRYRQYSGADISWLDHILRIKSFGFTLREIKRFIEKNDYRPKVIRAAVKQKIAMVESEMKMLEKRRNNLRRLLRQFQ